MTSALSELSASCSAKAAWKSLSLEPVSFCEEASEEVSEEVSEEESEEVSNEEHQTRGPAV